MDVVLAASLTNAFPILSKLKLAALITPPLDEKDKAQVSANEAAVYIMNERIMKCIDRLRTALSPRGSHKAWHGSKDR